MLRKLMKHEFRATGRIMLPLYLVLIVTAFGANLSSRGLMSADNWFLNLLGSLLIMAFSMAIFGVFVMSVVVMVQRFYKNLLGDEGYVMFTLPVSVHQHIWSKLIVSAVWFAATILAVCLASMIVVYDVGFIRHFLKGMGDLIRSITGFEAFNGTALAAELLVLCFLCSCAMCLLFYAALAAGHKFPSHKMAWSVLFFFVFWFGSLILVDVALELLAATNFFHFLAGWNLSGLAALHAGIGVLTAGVVIYGAIFYLVTTFFLKKHLNLE